MNLDEAFQYKSKIKTVDELIDVLHPWPRKKKVIMCHGVFDIVHPGHLRHLIYAKSKGDLLVVSITADRHIIKGEIRPHVPEKLRAINLAAFEMVDYVIIDDEATPHKNLGIIKPNYFAKGYEYIENGTHKKTQVEIDILDEYGGEMLFTPGDIVYSSSRFIEMSPPKISEEKLMTLMNTEKITFNDLRDVAASLTNIKIHVVGDTIVDSYSHCSIIGGMVKTPTMSLRYEKKEDYTGGAAIVAKHLKAAGADVTFSTILGNDAFKDYVMKDLRKHDITCLPIIDNLRNTTNKNAFVVGDYRVLKIDTVDNNPLSDKLLKRLEGQISEAKVDGVVFSDFRHGIFHAKSIQRLISAIPKDTYRIADSQVASRWGNILDFKNFDLITPNEKEARFSLGDQDSVIRFLGQDLFKQSRTKALFLKLGSRGLIVFRDAPDINSASFFLDVFTQRAIDPIGAGDALLAYATLAMVKTKNEVIAAILGSLAAAIECEKNGNVSVFPQEIHDRLNTIEKAIQYRN